MADNFDPCECVFSHEGAMQRLISLLQSSQGYCTPEECFTIPPGPAPASQNSGDDGTVLMLTMGWLFMALVLFFLRPTSLSVRGNEKPSNNQGPQPPPDNSVQ